MWEYKIIDSANAEKGGFLKGRTVEQAETYLNSLGTDGWEIIDIDFQMDPTMPGDLLIFMALQSVLNNQVYDYLMVT